MFRCREGKTGTQNVKHKPKKHRKRNRNGKEIEKAVAKKWNPNSSIRSPTVHRIASNEDTTAAADAEEDMRHEE